MKLYLLGNDFFYRISELKLATLIQRYDKKVISCFDPIQVRETNWNFTGCQVPHYMVVVKPYINLLKPFLDNEMSVFEEYGALK